ncbi:MAG: ribosome biogenesis GTPase Der [Pseudomonadota bacterium]
MKPIIAIVGRPNVGKSTLFNRLTGTRDAMVNDRPGVTRDRHYADAEWNGVAFTLVDTGGFAAPGEDPFADQIRQQVMAAIAEADAVIQLFDGKHGLSPYDREMTTITRQLAKPVFFAVNKIDDSQQEGALSDFYALGLETVFPVSAEHKYGIMDLMDAVVADYPAADSKPEADIVRVAVVGRPNAGKSSLINRLLGEDRLVVSEVPGTTRDSVDSICKAYGKNYRLVDTAGIRRKGRVQAHLEKISIIMALRSLSRCDVALIVLDAAEGVTDQDISIAGYAEERGCGCVFLLNKWDLVEKDQNSAAQYAEKLREQAKFLQFAPVITVSALTGQRMHRIFEAIDTVNTQYNSRIGTGPLNRILKEAVDRNEPSLHRGRRIKFLYATQSSTKPPTFVLFVNYPDAVHFSYRRYLTNRIREGTGLHQTPLRLMFRQRSGRLQFDDYKKPPSFTARGKSSRKRGTRRK